MGLRVVVADDSYLVREAITHVLSGAPGIDLCAVCDHRDSLMAAIEAEAPDVVVTDIRMPPGRDDEGVRVAIELRETHPGMGVVLLSMYLEPRYALDLLAKGSDGRAYLLKDRIHDRAGLTAAIEATAAGGSVIDPKVVEALVSAQSRLEESPLEELTPRERQILEEMAQGKSNAAIAETLVLAERSVEKVIHSIFLKLGLTWQPDINRRVKAVLVFLSEQRAQPETPKAR